MIKQYTEKHKMHHLPPYMWFIIIGLTVLAIITLFALKGAARRGESLFAVAVRVWHENNRDLP